jgi:hypothetical protein
VLATVMHTDLIHLITTFIQQPLRLINTSLPGTIFIYSFGNFLFTLGIHQSVVNSVVLEPFLLINTNENMLAFANGQPIPYHQQYLCSDLWHGGRHRQYHLTADRYFCLLTAKVCQTGCTPVSGAGFIQYQRTRDFWSADCL